VHEIQRGMRHYMYRLDARHNVTWLITLLPRDLRRHVKALSTRISNHRIIVRTKRGIPSVYITPTSQRPLRDVRRHSLASKKRHRHCDLSVCLIGIEFSHVQLGGHPNTSSSTNKSTPSGDIISKSHEVGALVFILRCSPLTIITY